jgi:Zn finger protein HypA/HybF involved in hydrogenase expression
MYQKSKHAPALKGKVKLLDATTHINMKIITLLGAIAAAVLFFFGVIFAMAASVQATATRLTVSVMLFAVGCAIAAIAYYTTRKPKTVIQQLELSGQMKAAALKCPNCSASVDANQIKIVSGVPYATCPYCGNTFEVTEEPKW